MCDQTQLIYKPNDVVWVKLGNIWWPAEVQDQASLSEEVTHGLKKKPLAIVKFFNEDLYEFIKNLDQIYHYNCLRKNEFIQKGLGKCGPKYSSSVPSGMVKFPDDVRHAELITGGNPDICDVFKDKPEEELSLSSPGGTLEQSKTPMKGPLKRSHIKDTTEIPPKKNRHSLPPNPSEINDIQPTSSMSASKIISRPKSKSRPSFSSIPSKLNESTVFNKALISPEMVAKIKKKNYQSFIRIQPGIPDYSGGRAAYKCYVCSDTTRQVDFLKKHYDAHEKYGMHLPPMSPKAIKANEATPGTSGVRTSFTPKTKLKSEKQRRQVGSKSNETPIKKRSKKEGDSTPRARRSSSNNNARTSSAKRKLKKGSHLGTMLVDENNVLRDKLLKDWDDESDDDVNCGSVLKTTAEIHSASNNQINDGPQEDDRITSETLDKETPVTLNSDHNLNDVTLPDGANCHEVPSAMESVQCEAPSGSADEEKRSSCFDFEDNDEAINLDTSHKFGQKLPRLLSGDKTKKSVIEKPIDETDEPSKDDCSLIRNQVEELLEATKMSELPDISQTNSPNKESDQKLVNEQDTEEQLTESMIESASIRDELIVIEGVPCEIKDSVANRDIEEDTKQRKSTGLVGGKLPRLLSGEKTKKSIIVKPIDETDEPSKDDCALIESQVEELLQVTKMRELPNIPQISSANKESDQKLMNDQETEEQLTESEIECSSIRDELKVTESILYEMKDSVTNRGFEKEDTKQVKTTGLVRENQPRFLSDDKTKKSVIEKPIDETDEPSKDDSNVIENQVEELLEVTKMSELQNIPQINATNKETISEIERGSIRDELKVTEDDPCEIKDLSTSRAVEKEVAKQGKTTGLVGHKLPRSLSGDKTKKSVIGKPIDETDEPSKDDCARIENQVDELLEVTKMSELPDISQINAENKESDQKLMNEEEIEEQLTESEIASGSIRDELKVSEVVPYEIKVSVANRAVDKEDTKQGKTTGLDGQKLLRSLSGEKTKKSVIEKPMDETDEPSKDDCVLVENQVELLEVTNISGLPNISQIKAENKESDQKLMNEKEIEEQLTESEIESGSLRDEFKLSGGVPCEIKDSAANSAVEIEDIKHGKTTCLDGQKLSRLLSDGKTKKSVIEEPIDETDEPSKADCSVIRNQVGELLEVTKMSELPDISQTNSPNKESDQKLVIEQETEELLTESEIESGSIRDGLNVIEGVPCEIKDSVANRAIKEEDTKQGKSTGWVLKKNSVGDSSVDTGSPDIGNEGNKKLIQQEEINSELKTIPSNFSHSKLHEPDNVNNEINEGNNKEKNSSDFAKEVVIEKYETIEPKNTNLLPLAQELITTKEKFIMPELVTYDNVLMDETSGLPQWTAMEYYADLEAQVRTDVHETKPTSSLSDVDNSNLIKEKALRNIEKSISTETLNDSVNNKIDRNNGDIVLKELLESNKVQDLQSDKTIDTNKSGVIFEFKLDGKERLGDESPSKLGMVTGKSKKRKWESKHSNDKVTDKVSSVKDNSCNNLVLMEAEDQKKEDGMLGNTKKEIIKDNVEEVLQDQKEETPSKKWKFDTNKGHEHELLVEDEEVQSVEVLKEITIPQDSGVINEEVIVSTSQIEESLEVPSTKPSLHSAEGNGVKSEVISVPTNAECGNLPEIKMELNYPTLPEKNEVKKKETTFDPSQMELDINSMPVVIEEDLIQDIKLTSSPATNATRPNTKQIRIQLRKAGESNSSLLQGNQNGKIIRIPGTSKEPVINKSNQGSSMPSTSRFQAVSNLMPQRTIGNVSQGMLLKVGTLQGSSGSTKYTFGKNQMRTATPTIAGQPLKLVIQQQNAKLIMQGQSKPFTTSTLTGRITTSLANISDLTGTKTITTTSQTNQNVIRNRQLLSNKNINKDNTVTTSEGNTVINKTATITTQKNTKSSLIEPVSTHTFKNVFPVVQGTNIQVVNQSATPKVVMHRRTKTVASSVASVKPISPQPSPQTVFVHTSQGVVRASKAVAKHILKNHVPQTSPRPTPPPPPVPLLTNIKKNPVNKSRHSNINILQRSQKKNNRQQTVIHPQTQQQNKQVLISGGSMPSHELILNNVPVQFQNLGTTQPGDVKMLYIVDESGGQYQVDNSPLIAIDNTAENRSVFIESNSATDVDNLFLTFGDTNVVNVSSAAATPSQDILAKALANTQVLQSDTDTTDMPDTIEGTTTLYVEPQYPAPTLAHNVLETSFSLNSPIMTPLEVPSSVTPQVTSLTSNLIPVTTVETVKKNDAQPSMPLLTDDVEVATGQTVYLDSSSLVSGTSQAITFQVINSDGNIVVASNPTTSAQVNATSSNKVNTNQVLFSTELLKTEPRQLTIGRAKVDMRSSSQIAIENLNTSDVNQGENDRIPPTISIEHLQDNSLVVQRNNRKVIQGIKVKKDRRRTRIDTVRPDKRFKNIAELDVTNRQDVSSVIDDALQKRLQQETSEKLQTEVKIENQQIRTITTSNKPFKSFTLTPTNTTVLSDINDPKFTIEEKR